jgi:hypothetical protein
MEQAERMVRELATVQRQMKALRQRAEKAELEVKSLLSSLATREQEITKLKEELKKAKSNQSNDSPEVGW